MTFSKTSLAILTLSAAVAAGLVLTSALPSFAGKFAQNHPRRAEVLHRDNHLNNRLNKNYGNLGGHYGQLKNQDQRIHQQERRDKNINGGYITKGQKQQLNKEENHVNREIKQDKQ